MNWLDSVNPVMSVDSDLSIEILQRQLLEERRINQLLFEEKRHVEQEKHQLLTTLGHCAVTSDNQLTQIRQYESKLAEYDQHLLTAKTTVDSFKQHVEKSESELKQEHINKYVFQHKYQLVKGMTDSAIDFFHKYVSTKRKECESKSVPEEPPKKKAKCNQDSDDDFEEKTTEKKSPLVIKTVDESEMEFLMEFPIEVPKKFTLRTTEYKERKDESEEDTSCFPVQTFFRVEKGQPQIWFTLHCFGEAINTSLQKYTLPHSLNENDVVFCNVSFTTNKKCHRKRNQVLIKDTGLKKLLNSVNGNGISAEMARGKYTIINNWATQITCLLIKGHSINKKRIRTQESIDKKNLKQRLKKKKQREEDEREEALALKTS